MIRMDNRDLQGVTDDRDGIKRVYKEWLRIGMDKKDLPGVTNDRDG